MRNEAMSQLICDVQSKKAGSFERLYKEIWQMAFYYCQKRLGNVHDAEDAAQEVVVKVYNTIDTVKAPEAFNSILSKIMATVCIDAVRRKKLPEAECDITEIPETVPDDKEFLPEALLLHKELRRHVVELVDNLPSKQREAVMLFYFSELKQAEISKITNSDLNAVNNRLVIARKTLRKQVEELLKREGLYHYAAAPILTQLLWQDCAEICTSAVGDKIWRNAALKLGLNPNAFMGTAKNSAPQKAVRTPSLLNAGLAVVAVATVIIGGMLGFNIYRNLADPVPAVQTHQDREDIIAALKKVKTAPQLEEFVECYAFAPIAAEKYEDGRYTLFERIYPGGKIRVGSFETEDGEFEITYEVTDSASGAPGDIRAWVLSIDNG